MRELAVLLEFKRAEIHIAAGLVCEALVYERADHCDDVLYILCCLGVNGSVPHIKSVRIGFVLGNVLLADLFEGGAFFVCAIDYLIVDIGEVLNIGDLVALVFKIASEHIEYADGTGVAYVNVVVNGGTACVNAEFALVQRDKFFFLSGESIINFHELFSFSVFLIAFYLFFEIFYSFCKSVYFLLNGVWNVYLVEIVNAYAVAFYHPCRSADGGRVFGDLVENHTSGCNVRVVADLEGTEHLCARTYHNAVAHCRVALADILAGSAERYALIYRHIVAHLGSFAYYHACAVVYEKALADLRAGVNLYICLLCGALRNIPRDEVHIVLVKPMGFAVCPHGFKPGVEEQHFKGGGRRRVAFPYAFDIFFKLTEIFFQQKSHRLYLFS